MVWELTTEGERLFHCRIVRGGGGAGGGEEGESASGHGCMSGIYNIGHCVMT